MNMPTSPVHTLPFNSTTTASASANSAITTTLVLATTEWSSRQIPMSKNDSGLKPRIKSPATATAANTASTSTPSVLGPAHVLQMQDEGELVEDESGADPEDDRGDCEFGDSPITASVTIVTPERHHQNHADHHVVDVQRAVPDVARLPPLSRCAHCRRARGCTARWTGSPGT